MQKMIFYSGVGWWSPRWTGGGLEVDWRWSGGGLEVDFSGVRVLQPEKIKKNILLVLENRAALNAKTS